MKTAEGAVFSAWGLCPQTPEIYRIEPTSKEKKTGGASRPPSTSDLERRSGCVSAEPYPPSR
jgi:hypothetical protein